MKPEEKKRMAGSGKAKKRAFTLIELLVVISIIGLIVAFAFPAFLGATRAAKRNKAKTQATEIAQAVMSYLHEYGRLPIPDTEQGKKEPDYYVGPDTPASLLKCKVIIKALTANDQAGDLVRNPKKIVFLESPDGKTDGTFLDPYGVQYAMKFDADYNGVLEYFSGGNNPGSESITLPVVVASYGPNKTQSTLEGIDDDIVSFEARK